MKTAIRISIMVEDSRNLTREEVEALTAAVKWAPGAMRSHLKGTGLEDATAVFTNEVIDNSEDRVKQALGVIFRYGGIEGDHHRAWVIDQVVKALAPNYEEWVADYERGEPGDPYIWDTGIAP